MPFSSATRRLHEPVAPLEALSANPLDGLPTNTVNSTSAFANRLVRGLID